MFIQILDLDFFLILDPGSGGLKKHQIPDPRSKSLTLLQHVRKFFAFSKSFAKIKTTFLCS
jgi:hypothetical protein